MIYIIIGILLGYIYQKLILPKKSKANPKIDITFYPILYNGMIIIPIIINLLFIFIIG